MYIVQYAQYSTVIMVNVLFSTVYFTIVSTKISAHCTLTASLQRIPETFQIYPELILKLKTTGLWKFDKGVGERRGGGMKTFKLKLRSKN